MGGGIQYGAIRNVAQIIVVEAGGHLILEAGVVITGNAHYNDNGGGVYVAVAGPGSPKTRSTTAGPAVYLNSAKAVNWEDLLPMTSGAWETGTLEKTGQVVWYSFTAVSPGDYSLGWEDRTDQAATMYTGDIVGVYDGSLIPVE
jgi:hypothetical protein